MEREMVQVLHFSTMEKVKETGIKANIRMDNNMEWDFTCSVVGAIAKDSLNMAKWMVRVVTVIVMEKFTQDSLRMG